MGFHVKHVMLRVRTLAREVLRLNKYVGNEEKTPITGSHLYAEIRRFLASPSDFVPQASDDFIAMDEGEGENITGLSGDANHVESNKAVREPQLEEAAEKLKPFFNAVAIFGAHPTIRRLTGFDRHSSLDWEQARDLLEELCTKHREESFLVPEQTTYGYDPRLSADDWQLFWFLRVQAVF